MRDVTAEDIPGLKLALEHCTKYEDRMWFSFLIKMFERQPVLTPAERMRNYAERIRRDPELAKAFLEHINQPSPEPGPFDGSQRYYPEESENEHRSVSSQV